MKSTRDDVKSAWIILKNSKNPKEIRRAQETIKAYKKQEGEADGPNGITDRSDGCKKFYWKNPNGELCTMTMEPDDYVGKYNMCEFRVNGKPKFYKNDVTGRIVHVD